MKFIFVNGGRESCQIIFYEFVVSSLNSSLFLFPIHLRHLLQHLPYSQLYMGFFWT